MRRRLGVSAALVDGAWVAGDVAVHDGVVDAVGLIPARGGATAVAGLVDVQCNGYAGVDLTGLGEDATDDEAIDAVRALRRAVAADGVTAVAPTLISAAPGTTRTALRRLDTARSPGGADGARLLAAHVEGPFLSPARRGTHPAAHLRAPDRTLLADLLSAGTVGLLTLAPELDGAPALVADARWAGVTVLAGHSDASAAQAHAGFDAGVAGATHLFNAMTGADHRAAGLAAVALARPDVTVTLIADGHHVHPDVVRLAVAAAPGRVALVTDATAAAGRPDGRFRLGGVEVTLAGGAVRNDAGDLAGSAATLLGCVRTAVDAGVDPTTALLAATAVPASLVPPRHRPHADLGRLRPGGVADLVVLGDDLAVVAAHVAGRAVTVG